MLVNESADAARARWSDLPAGVQERGNNWWAPVAMGDDEQEAWLHAQDGLGAHALGLVGFGQEAWQDEEEEEAHMDD